jgi:hypothetical protein
VGEPSVRDDKDEDRFTVEETDNIEGYCSRSPSSEGRHVSTIASKQFTNNSALSAVQFDCKKTYSLSNMRHTTMLIFEN